MNRWKMHKLGFLNFWLYDQEEFMIRDGHILLRAIMPPENPLRLKALFRFFWMAIRVRNVWIPLALETVKWSSIFSEKGKRRNLQDIST